MSKHEELKEYLKKAQQLVGEKVELNQEGYFSFVLNNCQMLTLFV